MYRLLQRQQRLELALVLYAAAMVAAVFPLRSQLWWPSCALLMLVAVVAPLGRVLAYCIAVLALNLLAHVLTGDLGKTPAVSIIGLWIGYIFWSLTVAAITDQLAAYLMLLNRTVRARRTATRRVVSWIGHEPSDPVTRRPGPATATESGSPARLALPPAVPAEREFEDPGRLSEGS
jgi:hypothetical protein